MNILLAVLKDFKTYFNIKTTYGRKHSVVLAATLVIALVGWNFFAGSDNAANETNAPLSEVSVLSVAELGAEARFDTIGKVEAVSEANLQTEAGGRVTSVSVAIGDRVGAGSILATLENNSQRAALVQAQGSYEAALAAAAQNSLGVNDAEISYTNAKNGAVSTYRNSYNTVNGIVRNSIDPFFGNPDATLPGLRIDGAGYTATLNSERIAYQSILRDWQNRSNTITADSNIEQELQYAKANVDRTINMVDTFITLFNQEGRIGGYSTEELQAYSTQFTTLRASLIGSRSAIDGAITALTTAKNATEKARLSASGSGSSAADAQVKIALGSLQAAQANYQKTIIRTPIGGVVNAFYLNAGDYVSPGQPAGIVANNNGLQIKTFVSEADSASLNVGDAVTIEGNATGVITAKAAALDPTNGKVAIVVGVNEASGLTNGATVSVTFSQISKVETTDRILVPLSALKITATGTSVFTVSEESKLVAVPVTQGQLYGENIELTSGVTKETRIVVDARGLKEGQSVTIKK